MILNRTGQDGGTLGLVRTVVLILIVIAIVAAILLRVAPSAASILECKSETLHEVDAEEGCPDETTQVSGFILSGDNTVCCQKKAGVSQSAYEEAKARTSSIRNAVFGTLPADATPVETTFSGTYVENGEIVQTQPENPRSIKVVPNNALNNPENVITVVADEPFQLPFVHNHPDRRDIAKCRSDLRGTQFLSGVWTQTKRAPDNDFKHTGELNPCDYRDYIILEGSLELDSNPSFNVYKWDWTYWDEDGELIQDIGGAALIKVVDKDNVGATDTSGTQTNVQTVAHYELYPQGNEVHCIETPSRTGLSQEVQLNGQPELKENFARDTLGCTNFIKLDSDVSRNYNLFETQCRGVTCGDYTGSNRRLCDSEWNERSIEACRYVLSCYKPDLFEKNRGRCVDCREVNVDDCSDYKDERNCNANQCLGVDSACTWINDECVEDS